MAFIGSIFRLGDCNNNNEWWLFIHFPSLLIMGIVPLFFVSIIYGFKEMFSAFSIPFKKENDGNNLIKAYNFFKIYGKITWIVGLIFVVIIIITMVMSLEDKAGLGYNLVFALMIILYTAIINGIIILPYMLIIKKEIK